MSDAEAVATGAVVSIGLLSIFSIPAELDLAELPPFAKRVAQYPAKRKALAKGSSATDAVQLNVKDVLVITNILVSVILSNLFRTIHGMLPP